MYFQGSFKKTFFFGSTHTTQHTHVMQLPTIPTPPIALIRINKANYKEVVELCVSPEQESFVGTSAECLVDVLFYPLMVALAIQRTEDRKIVGLLRYQCVMMRSGWSIHMQRFLVDCKYQGCGYGHSAIDAFKEHLKEQFDTPIHVELNTRADNEHAIRFYRKAGFLFDPAASPELDVVCGHMVIEK